MAQPARRPGRVPGRFPTKYVPDRHLVCAIPAPGATANMAVLERSTTTAQAFLNALYAKRVPRPSGFEGRGFDLKRRINHLE
jgi:hypothetical protein